MSESASPESGALSVDQAIASLIDPPAIEETEAPEAPLEAAEGTEPEGEASAPEDTEDGAETPAEEDEAADAEEPEKLAAPLYWKPEAKEAFDKLDPALQAEILSQEGPREEAAAKAKANALAEVQAAQKDRESVNTLAKQLSEFLPQAVEAFKSKWGEPDWVKVIQEHGAENAAILKAQFEQEQKLLNQTAQATQTAQAEAHKAYVQTEWKALATIDPVLAPDPADPTKGAETRQKVTKFLVDRGIPTDAIAQISAVEMSLAHDAMRWREAQATLKAPKTPKPVAAPAGRAAVRPAAAQPQSSPQRTATVAANRFAQTRSPEDAIALLLAKG